MRSAALRVMAALLAVVAAYHIGQWQGDARGYARATAEHLAAREQTQAELNALGDRIRAQADALRAANVERRRLLQEIDDEIDKDPDTRRPGISDAGMRRLERAFAAP